MQVLDDRTQRHIEESGVVAALHRHMGHGVALAVKHARKGRGRAADAGERHARQVQIPGQLVVLRQHCGVLGRRQRLKLRHGGNGLPLDGAAVQLRPQRTLELVLGGALEPQHPVAVLHRRRGGADVGQGVVDGEHPAIRRVDCMAVDGVDEPSEGGGGGVAVRQLALRLSRVHHVHHAGVAGALHGDIHHALVVEVEGVRLLVIRHHGHVYGDVRGFGRLRRLHRGEIGQAAVHRVVAGPDAAAQLPHEVRQPHLHAGSRLRAVTVSAGVLAVVVAVPHAFRLVVLEAAVRLVAADEAVALCARHRDDTRSVAALIGVALEYGASHEAAGIAAARHVPQCEAVADGAAVAQAHKAAGVVALGADAHGGPAPLDEAALLVGAHEARVARGGSGVGGQRTALHIAVADGAVVPADHAAQHRAGVGGDVGVHHGALLHEAVVVVYQHRRVVGEQHVGVLHLQIVDIAAGPHVPEQAGVIVAQCQAADDVSVAVQHAVEPVGGVADGLGLGLIGRRQLGEIQIVGQIVFLAPLHLLLAVGAAVCGIGGHILHVGQVDPLLGGGDGDPRVVVVVRYLRRAAAVIDDRLGRAAVRQAHCLQDVRVGVGDDLRGIAPPGGEGVAQIRHARISRHLHGGQGAIAAIVLYNGQQDGVDLLRREIGLLVPAQDRTLPLHIGDGGHAVIGHLIARHILVHVLQRRLGVRAVHHCRHRGVVHALALLRQLGGAVIVGLSAVGGEGRGAGQHHLGVVLALHKLCGLPPQGDDIPLRAVYRVPRQLGGGQHAHTVLHLHGGGVGEMHLLQPELHVLSQHGVLDHRCQLLPLQHRHAAVAARHMLKGVADGQLLHLLGGLRRRAAVAVRAAVQIEAVADSAVGARGDSAGIGAGNGAAVVAVGHRALEAAVIAADTAACVAAAGDAAGVVAVADVYLMGVAAADAASPRLAADVAGVVAGADGDHGAAAGVLAQDAAAVVAAADGHFAAALRDGHGAALGAGHKARRVAAAAVGAGGDALHHHAADLRVLHHAEQARVPGLRLHAGHRMTLAVKAARELMGICADRRPSAIAQVDVLRQDGV